MKLPEPQKLCSILRSPAHLILPCLLPIHQQKPSKSKLFPTPPTTHSLASKTPQPQSNSTPSRQDNNCCFRIRPPVPARVPFKLLLSRPVFLASVFAPSALSSGYLVKLGGTLLAIVNITRHGIAPKVRKSTRISPEYPRDVINVESYPLRHLSWRNGMNGIVDPVCRVWELYGPPATQVFCLFATSLLFLSFNGDPSLLFPPREQHQRGPLSSLYLDRLSAMR